MEEEVEKEEIEIEKEEETLEEDTFLEEIIKEVETLREEVKNLTSEKKNYEESLGVIKKRDQQRMETLRKLVLGKNISNDEKEQIIRGEPLDIKGEVKLENERKKFLEERDRLLSLNFNPYKD